jgi:hypothetical protein
MKVVALYLRQNRNWSETTSKGDKVSHFGTSELVCPREQKHLVRKSSINIGGF